MKENMGVGLLSTSEIKRPFRWTFDVEVKVAEILTKIPNTIVKSVDFPRFKVVDHKKVWEPITVEYYDVPSETGPIWDWLLQDDRSIYAAGYLTYLTGDGKTLDGFRIAMSLLDFSVTKPDYSDSSVSLICLTFDVNEVIRGEPISFQNSQAAPKKAKTTKKKV